jgi:hypothetical protein
MVNERSIGVRFPAEQPLQTNLSQTPIVQKQQCIHKHVYDASTTHEQQVAATYVQIKCGWVKHAQCQHHVRMVRCSVTMVKPKGNVFPSAMLNETFLSGLLHGDPRRWTGNRTSLHGAISQKIGKRSLKLKNRLMNLKPLQTETY